MPLSLDRLILKVSSTSIKNYNQTSSIVTLNAHDINDAINNPDRPSNSAKLLYTTLPQSNILTSRDDLLACVKDLVTPNIVITNSSQVSFVTVLLQLQL